MPVSARRLDTFAVALSMAVLLTHAAVYWFAVSLRGRFGVAAYAAAQATLVLAFALVAKPGAVTLGLLMLLTVEMLMVAGARWGALPITAAAVALFIVAELLTGGLYQAANAGLVLALTGAIAHGAIVLARQSASVERAGATIRNASTLSMRETEVLRELVAGARNAEIGATLGITERTVKAHVTSIYLKLGVETRAAAVAAAVQRHLV
jgi:DNA-binding CsgD family transcriptional regulator